MGERRTIESLAPTIIFWCALLFGVMVGEWITLQPPTKRPVVEMLDELPQEDTSPMEVILL